MEELVKVRSKWSETLFLLLDGQLVRVDPDSVVDVPDTCSDLLEQRDGALFALVDAAPAADPKE
jgi:hypothetical protein